MPHSHSKPSVQDELESFFHVILYIAILLLPHNCSESEVPRLLHDFFEASTLMPYGYISAGMKSAVMHLGTINIERYICQADRPSSPRRALTFLYPQSSAHPTPTVEALQAPRPPCTDEMLSRSRCVMHPLNNIVDELLRWFNCAHYTPKPRPRPVAESGDMTLPTPPDVLEIMETLARLEARKKRLRAKQVVLGLALVVAEPEPEPEPKCTIDCDAIQAREDAEAAARWERMREVRAKLESHDAMVALLADTLVEKVWPAVDRIDRNLECLRFE